jgi:hypothetical protein
MEKESSIDLWDDAPRAAQMLVSSGRAAVAVAVAVAPAHDRRQNCWSVTMLARQTSQGRVSVLELLAGGTTAWKSVAGRH